LSVAKDGAGPGASKGREDLRRQIEAVVHGEHDDPFGFLGLHPDPDTGVLVLRSFQPGASRLWVLDADSGQPIAELTRLHPEGFFAGSTGRRERFRYRLRRETAGRVIDFDDPYRFPPVLGELDMHLFAEGRHLRIYDKLGSHPIEMDGVAGVTFAVWAPNARRVSVVGSFNNWDGRWHPMRRRVEGGIWEIFMPGIGPGAVYKYEIKGPDGRLQPLKADPYAQQFERPPNTASIVAPPPSHAWTDQAWMAGRAQANARSSPISIYECHLGSWARVPEEGHRFHPCRVPAHYRVSLRRLMGLSAHRDVCADVALRNPG
jgi:1,4-alpha-glucan branching enzyme